MEKRHDETTDCHDDYRGAANNDNASWPTLGFSETSMENMDTSKQRGNFLWNVILFSNIFRYINCNASVWNCSITMNI